MAQTPQERRAAQRRLAKQLKGDAYERSAAGKWAREAATVLGEHRAHEAEGLLREAEADEAWFAAEPKMAFSPVITYGPPVRSSKPSDPRIDMMEYWRNARMVKVYWGDHKTPYVFFEIDISLWVRWRSSASPGKFINRVLRGKPYMPAPF
jgi:hypothetical protein